MGKTVSPALNDLCDRLAEATWANVGLLRSDDSPDELCEYLYDWAVVLATVAIDIFETRNDMIRRDRVRAAQILQRSLIDYAIRLRYYLVQSIKLRRRYRTACSELKGRLKQQMQAARDWDERDFTLGKKLAKYDRDFWPDELRAELADFAADRREPSQRSVPEMGYFLLEHECGLRSIIKTQIPILQRHYRATIAEWFGHSTYVHGDQGIVSDVLEFSGTTKTGKIWRIPESYRPKTVMFEGISQMIHLNESIAILRGWAYGTQGAFLDAVSLWNEP